MSRSVYYYSPNPEDTLNLILMRIIDEEYTKTPMYGSPKMTQRLRNLGHPVNHKRIERLMRLMGLQALTPKRRLTTPGKNHRIYPYLLAGMKIERPNQVWSSDITYIPMRRGFLYLVAVLDWFSRYVVSWELSNSLDTTFCLDALDRALSGGCPEVFNTDQGCQFTSEDFTRRLDENGVRISMDGRGRCFDNIFIERLWRTVKYEEVYLREYASARDAFLSLRRYFDFYNRERLHQSLDYKVPQAVHFSQLRIEGGASFA